VNLACTTKSSDSLQTEMYAMLMRENNVHEMIDQKFTVKNNDKRKHQLNVFAVVLLLVFIVFSEF